MKRAAAVLCGFSSISLEVLTCNIALPSSVIPDYNWELLEVTSGEMIGCLWMVFRLLEHHVKPMPRHSTSAAANSNRDRTE